MGMGASRLSRLIKGDRAKQLKWSPLETPKGYVPIYVGKDGDTKRFMVHRKTLRDADVLEMLYKSAEEYGFHNQGPLRIPFDAKHFEELIISRPNQNIFRVKPV